MATLKAIRKRISSIRNTQQITKAMKMVSAAKLRRAQEAGDVVGEDRVGACRLVLHLPLLGGEDRVEVVGVQVHEIDLVPGTTQPCPDPRQDG